MLSIINNSFKHQSFVYTRLNDQTVLFPVIQCSISHLFAHSLMSNSSIWPIDRILSGAITLGQSGPGSDGNEGVLHIPQSSGITGASLSDCLMSYLGHSVGEILTPSAEMQSVYSTMQTQNVNFLWPISIELTSNSICPSNVSTLQLVGYRGDLW